VLFRDVQLWNSKGLQRSVSLRVENKIVREISEYPLQLREGEELIDGKGRMALIPAGVDLQVHLRVPGQAQKETAETGLKAALKGGYAALLTMPNTKPVIDRPEILKKAQSETSPWEKQTGVKVLWSVAMTLGQLGETPVDALALKDVGALALTDDGVGVFRDDVMAQVFEQAQKSRLPLLQHAEVPGHGGVLAPGPTQEKLGLKAYPEEAEWKMVERDLDLLKKFPDVRYHVLHVSSAHTLNLVKKARAEGLQVTAEVTPHHLYFCNEDIPDRNTSYKMNPPLRSTADRAALCRALEAGDIAFVSTDHAPHEAQLKGPDFSASAYGTTGLETSLRVLLDLHARGLLSASRLVEVFSSAPARFIGIWDQGYGRIEKDQPFRAVLVDPEAPASPIGLEDLASQSHNNIFLGHALRGRLARVFL
jgi:dihydroorotase